MNLIKQFPNNISVFFSSEDTSAFREHEKPNHISANVNPTTRTVAWLGCSGTPCEICPFDNIYNEATSCNHRATLILKRLTTKFIKTKELHAVPR